MGSRATHLGVKVSPLRPPRLWRVCDWSSLSHVTIWLEQPHLEGLTRKGPGLAWPPPVLHSCIQIWLLTCIFHLSDLFLHFISTGWEWRQNASRDGSPARFKCSHGGELGSNTLGLCGPLSHAVAARTPGKIPVFYRNPMSQLGISSC